MKNHKIAFARATYCVILLPRRWLMKSIPSSFVRIANKPDGKPGIYYEPFMYHFGRSAHVPGSQIVKLSPPTPEW